MKNFPTYSACLRNFSKRTSSLLIEDNWVSLKNTNISFYFYFCHLISLSEIFQSYWSNYHQNNIFFIIWSLRLNDCLWNKDKHWLGKNQEVAFIQLELIIFKKYYIKREYCYEAKKTNLNSLKMQKPQWLLHLDRYILIAYLYYMKLLTITL